MFNEFLCHLIYAPLAVFFTVCFTAVNIISVPFGYIAHLYNLISSLCDADETIDEFDEKVRRVFTILKFLLFGPFILIIALPIDSFVFAYNLYSEPVIEREQDDQQIVLSEETI